jgi:hypothetical protein
LIDPAEVRFNPNVPLPDPVFAETVYVVPLPETATDPAPTTPPAWTSVKFDAATPVTADENTTFHDADEAFVGDAAFSVNDDTVGPGGAPDATVAAAITTSTPSRAAITAVLRAGLLGLIGLILRTRFPSLVVG